MLSLESSKIEYDQPKGKELTTQNYRSLNQLEDKTLAHKIMKYREQTRKRYNVNSIGRYNGGIPQPDTFARGEALDVPGAFHDVEMQRLCEDSDNVSDFFVNRQDVVEYGRYMLDDRLQFGVNRTWFRAKIDENYFSLRKYSFTFKLVFLAFGLYISWIWLSGLKKIFAGSLRKDEKSFTFTESGIMRLN